MTLTLKPTAAYLAPRCTLHGVRILTRYYGSVGLGHSCAWCAWLEDAAPGAPSGFGPTKAAAIADLCAQLAALGLTRHAREPRWWIITRTIAIMVLTPVLVIGLAWCAWAICVAGGLQ